MFLHYILILIYYRCQLVASEFSITARATKLQTTEIQNAPFAVIVILRNNKYFCTGTIVSQEFVLTAAHCIFDLNGHFTETDQSVTVLAGSNKLYNYTEDVASGIVQVRDSEKIIVYPQYSWLENFIDDLALIKVKEPFTLTDRVSVVPMYGGDLDISQRKYQIHGRYDEEVVDEENMGDSFNSKQLCVGYGFGKLMRFKNFSDDYMLKSQMFSVKKNCTCLQYVHSTKSRQYIHQKMGEFLCNEANDYTGLCEGDNGGQLMCGGRLVAIGAAVLEFQDRKTCRIKPVENIRNECGDINSLSVFTDISYYQNWLNHEIFNYPNTKTFT